MASREKGRLSKLRKHELEELLKKYAPGGESKEPTGINGGIRWFVPVLSHELLCNAILVLAVP